MRRIMLMAAVWAVVSAAALTIGPESLSLGEVGTILAQQFPGIAGGEIPLNRQAIVMDVRLPRILLAGLVGAALSLSGTALQGLFRNPMASPYVLGISSGAALGAVIALIWNTDVWLAHIPTIPLFAFGGAVLATFIVYSLSRIKGRVPVATLLLAGIALGSFLSAVVSLILVFSEETVASVIFWLMGGLSGANWTGLLLVTPYFVLGTALLVVHSRELNALLLGEEASTHLGIDVESVKLRLLFSTSLLTAAAVAVTGVIGFVGLIVPHIVRLIVGPDHRLLIPLSGLSGAVLLTVMDTVARSLLTQEIPVGVISALLGGPFFIMLLRRHRAQLL
ncbi:MAG TPA: iron chelate uptake ABC transporter family permease subunit [Acidobacteriota bacterium]|nr:iron chelate uptake ABC transporter family permease subunit [Acidobacteriota bacterium]